MCGHGFLLRKIYVSCESQPEGHFPPLWFMIYFRRENVTWFFQVQLTHQPSNISATLYYTQWSLMGKFHKYTFCTQISQQLLLILRYRRMQKIILQLSKRTPFVLLVFDNTGYLLLTYRESQHMVNNCKSPSHSMQRTNQQLSISFPFSVNNRFLLLWKCLYCFRGYCPQTFF
jgi:hypothetical protein